jgi:hypothetical protein
MDLDLSISWCDRVNECTFDAHWLSEISPLKTRGSSPYAMLPAAKTAAAHQMAARFINTPVLFLKAGQ